MTTALSQTAAAVKLARGREKLLDAFLQKGQVAPFIQQQTALLDGYFTESFEESRVGPRMKFHRTPYAMIALGGYGRQEQCLYSDIDILILFQRQVPRAAEELVRETIYPLWDLGLEVGHAIRTLKDCLKLATADLQVCTALLDARFLCGMSLLYAQLRERLQQQLSGRRGRQMVGALREENQNRQKRYGDSSYLLEPNLKEGQGGLRDYHTVLWIARITGGLVAPRDLEYHGHLSHREYQKCQNALAFIWNVRNLLHFQTKGKNDHLYFEHQHAIARLLKFEDGQGQLAVERFLGVLHAHMDYLKQINRVFLMETAASTGFRLRPARLGRPAKIAADLEVTGHLLGFQSPGRILSRPELLLLIFSESARLQLSINSESRRIIREFLHLVDADFRRGPEQVKSFERILMTANPRVDVLNEMLTTGFLESFIPALGDIVNRIQYDGYHLYPIARHCLKTVRIIQSWLSPTASDQRQARLLQEIGPQKKFLLWAALLHDVGKGQAGPGHAGRGADLAARILTDAGYDKAAVSLVARLVRDHLFLIKVATRRDLNEEETALYCARHLGSATRLKMLYLLTMADSMATGPKAWNDWTAALLTDLYAKVLQILETGELASPKALAVIADKKAALLDKAEDMGARQKWETHFERLSPRYLLSVPVAALETHRELYEQLATRPLAWSVEPRHTSESRLVTICAPDQPGLFSKIAGVFCQNGLDVLTAEIFTWKNNVALDMFTVRPPADLLYEADCWEKIGRQLESALTEPEADFAPAGNRPPGQVGLKADPAVLQHPARPQQVVIDNQSSAFFTILEVFAYDFPGLLYQLTDLLFRHHIDVRLAKIATKIDQVVDVFYIRDETGQKITDPAHLNRLQTAVSSLLGRERASPGETSTI